MKYSVLTLALFALPHAAFAAEDDIEKITVEHRQAFRGDIPTRKLPQSITTLSKDLLDDNGVTDFQDALDFSASIARKNNGGGLWDSYSIRGLSGNENMPSGYLINGFSGGRGFSGPRDISNVEYIEVLKGPSSALYGRSEPGGTVNIITKKPQFTEQGELKAEVGSQQFQLLQADYTSGISDDTAVRINGAWQDNDSFRDVVHHDVLAITPSIYHRFSDKASLSYEFEFVDRRQMYDRGIVILNNNVETIPESRFLGNPNDGQTKALSRGHQGNFNYDFNADWTLLIGANFRQSTLNGFSSDAELSPSRQSLYEDGRTLTRQHRYRDYSSDDASVRFEVSGHFDVSGITNHILFGMDAYDYELRTGLYRYRGGKGTYTIDIFNPQHGGPGPDVEMQYENNEKQKAYGVYLQDQLDITEQFKMLLGLRFDEIEQTIVETKTAVTSENIQNRVSPRLGLVYVINDDLSFYSSYSEGFLPLSGTDFQGNPFGFEKSHSFEVGAKFRFADINGTFALFDATKSNMLVADPINVGYSAPLGKANSQGMELDLTGSLGADTEYTFSYAYVDAQTASDSLDVEWGVAVPKGSPLVNVPEHNLTLGLNHHFSLFGQTLNAGGRYQYISSRLGDPADLSFVLPSYQLVSLFAKWQTSDRISVSLNVDNIFDENYIDSSYNALWAYPGAPTQFKVGLTYGF